MRTQKRQSLGIKFAQKKFLKSKTINRNRNIFDIGEIDSYQTHQQKKRRTPYKSVHTQQIGEKLTQSFMNSTTVNSFKLESEIERHKQKVGGSKISSKNHTRYINYAELQPSHTKNLGIKKSVNMDKMITRQYRESLYEQDNRSEDRFNNFYFGMPDDSRTRGFDKYISREELEKLRVQTVPDSNPEIPIIYEKLAFPSTTFKVNWDYKRNKEQRGPIFFKVNKENSINLNEIGPQKIQNAKNRTSAKWNNTLNNFLSLSSKQQKSQFQRTLYSPNMDFRAKKQKRVSTGKVPRITEKKSYTEFERWELCDVKYFRVYHPSENRRRLNTE